MPVYGTGSQGVLRGDVKEELSELIRKNESQDRAACDFVELSSSASEAQAERVEAPRRAEKSKAASDLFHHSPFGSVHHNRRAKCDTFWAEGRLI